MRALLYLALGIGLCLTISDIQSKAASPAADRFFDLKSCQSGSLSINPSRPAFGYLRCADFIYAFAFSDPLDPNLAPMCDISLSRNAGAQNQLICTADNGKSMVIDWEITKNVSYKLTGEGKVSFSDQSLHSVAFNIGMMPGNWQNW